MTGLDTNVLIRYVMQDHEEQSALATRCVEALTVVNRGFISLITLVETVWVLSTAYRYDREQISVFIADLLHVRELVLERADIVAGALDLFRSGTADFSDGLICVLCQSAGCDTIFTFDRKAAKSAGMTLLEA